MIPGSESITLPANFSEFTHIIDVRSPGEFADDHIPGAINLPVLTNEQRAEVGTLDKQVSPFHARRLGAHYATDNISRHLADSLSDMDKDFTPLVYCWRGGMRSNSFATIMRAIGWRARTIQGGYKAYRNHVITRLEELLATTELQLHALSGLTGCGKTKILHALARNGHQVLDLEGLANHRGSLLGDDPTQPQPSQRLFETHLLETLERFDLSEPIWTEAESSKIGKIQCPPALWQKLSQSITYQVKLPLANRAELLKTDYAHFMEDGESLCGILDHLRRLRGHAQVDRWHEQIRSADWKNFLQSILHDHYDLSYRKPGQTSNYPEPSHTINIVNETQESIEQAAQELLQINLD